MLGEAAKNVPVDVRGLDAEIPWRRMSGLRDVLAHAYFGIDDDIVWSVVAEEVPSLLPRLVALRARLRTASAAPQFD
ncbi:HepT-like ribonuclease domain-containing protein [Luteitalea sp.]|uniref:HepT-like ribonuclease domain-containing protein n=1 Tax=Luteitalea sp. TaxID=2004800 RepID=UPI0025C02522|nr:HepT-like ribonuclease domain-containing protein [Luteitalea sp.]